MLNKGLKMAENKIIVKIKEPALTAISYLIPVVVAGGLLLAVGNIFGGKNITNFTGTIGVWDAFSTAGSLILGLLPVVVSTGVSFAIADKPGIAPGFLVGLISNMIKAGFLGGLIGGYVAGWFTILIVKTIKVPNWAQGLMPTLIIPFLSSILSAAVMFYILGAPIAEGQRMLTRYLTQLPSSQKFFYGAIIGILASVDYGGAINKTVFAFVLAMQAEGVNEPITVLILASMVTPFGFTFAYFLEKLFHKKIYTQTEVNTLKTAFPMGLCEITEGSLPIVLNDLWRSIVSTACGGAIGGGLSMLWGADSKIPASGLFAVPTMSRPVQFLIALLIGSLVTGIVFFLLKRPVSVESEKKEEKDVDLGDISIG